MQLAVCLGLKEILQSSLQDAGPMSRPLRVPNGLASMQRPAAASGPRNTITIHSFCSHIINMQRRDFIGGLLAMSLATPAIARRRKARSKSRNRRSQSRHDASQRLHMEKTRGGWRTPVVLAIGTILMLDSGEECRVVAVEAGYSWCEPLW